MSSPDDDDRFAIRPEVDAPTRAVHMPSFADIAQVEPAIEEPDLQLGGGAAQPIYDALQHFTDGDSALPSMDNGVMLAQGGPPPQSGSLVQGAPGPAPVPAPKKTAPRRKATAKPPTKQRDDWDKITATTDNKPGGYDIQWMKQLDPRVLKSIDGEYADDIADAAVAKRVKRDGKIAQIDSDRKRAIAAVRKTNGTTKKKGAKTEPADPVADGIAAAWDAQRAQREFEIRTELETNATVKAPMKSVSVPGNNTRKVRRADLQTRKRANYVADVNSLSRSPATTRKHLESFRAVRGTDLRKKPDGTMEKNPHAMMLSGDTATQFELARETFEKAHPGFTMPTTSVGYGTRGLHEEERGLGYLGHMLGTTFNLFAVENPNLDGPKGEGDINGFMLRKFGRDRSTNKPGRTQLDNFADNDIEAMGKRTADPQAPGTSKERDNDAALEGQIRSQYREMSATSQRFKGESSLGKKSMDELRIARSRYFELLESKKKEAALARRLNASGNDAALRLQLQDLHTANEGSDAEIRAVMRTQFLPWQQELRDDMERTRNDTAHDDKYKANELAVLQATHDNFSDPDRVFGGYHESKKTKGKLVADEVVTNVPIMQYLEKGFVRDDGTDYKNMRQGAVFNEDVFANLVRFGFGPGSRFGDTMHFDFIESQTNLVPGGRSAINIRSDRASPEKDLPNTPVPAPLNIPMAPPSTLAPPPTMLDVQPPPIPYRPKGIFDK